MSEEHEYYEEIEETVVSEEGADECVAKLKKLKQEIKKLKEEKQEYLTGWQAARAELVNAKKRMAEEQKEQRAWANARLLEDLLPIADSFGMAMSNKEVWESVDQNWRTGIEYIYSQMDKVFTEYGLVKIGEVETMFDARLHESVEQIETDIEALDGTIAEVRQPGYQLQDKVLRPAKVAVYHYQK